MTLEAKLKDIREKLEDDKNFPNESSISQGIVLPILQELNWDIFDTKVVRPELSLPGAKRKPELVDFALYEPPDTKAKVFIEVKAKGFKNPSEEAAETQLLRYTEGGKIPLAVLTDGGTWSFYLPQERGDGYGEKRVFKLDLSKHSKHSPLKSSEVLQRYLEKSRVVSGEALETARVFLFLDKRCKDESDKWQWMVDDGITQFGLAYSVLNSLAKNIKPKPSQDNIDHGIIDYFHSLLREKIPQSPSGATAQLVQPESRGQVPARLSSGTSELKQPAHRRVRQVSAPPELEALRAPKAAPFRIKELVIRGRSYPCRNQKEALVNVFKKLQEEFPNFLQDFYKHSGNRRGDGGCRYLGRDQRELWMGGLSPVQIGRDWVISTGYSWGGKKEIIELAAAVAGLNFKEDISIQGIILKFED